MTDNHPHAFVLMPFDERLDWAYDKLIRPAFEAAGYTVVRADDIDSQQNILKDIVTAIADADIVIADLTGANPNVYYELGLAHALRKQVVLLSQDVTKAPFDLRSYRIVEYGDRFDEFDSAQKRLNKLAVGIAQRDVRFGSPVSDFVSENHSTPVPADGDATSTHEHITSHEEEPGLLDLIADTEDGFAEQKQLLEKATEQIRLLGSYATAATPKIKDLTTSRDFRGMRQVFRRLSSQYDARTSDLHDVNHRLRLSWERTSDALEKRFHHSVTNEEARTQLLRSTREMCSKAAEAQTSIDYFTQQVDNLPNLDKMLTRSKRKLVLELRELVSYTEDVTSFEGRLARMLEAQD